MKKSLLILALFIISNTTFAQWTTSGSNIYYNTGNVGIGIATPNSLLTVGGNPSPNNGQQEGISYTPTATTGQYAGLTSQLTAAPTANSSAAFYGSYSQAGTSSAAGAFNLTGRIAGVGGGVSLRGTGIASTIYAFFALSPTFTSTGTATTSYGMYINPQKVTGVTTGYGVYQAGATDTNYFAGYTAIGTALPHGYRFAVNGDAIATSLTVKVYNTWPDYVFSSNYHLPNLTTVKNYINENHHLPDMPSADEVAKAGLNLGEINKQLTKKVEELTLYMIDTDKKDEEQETEIAHQKEQLDLTKQELALTKQQLAVQAEQLKKLEQTVTSISAKQPK